MQRILINTQATLSVTFEVNGVPTDPSPASATVTVTRDDGTAIATAAATSHDDDGVFTYTLTAGSNTLLDTLTAEWTSSLGTLVTTIEVVGGFLFSISEARSVRPLDNTSTYGTQAIIDARTLVEQALEDACGIAFVPRYARETFDGSGMSTVLGHRPLITEIRSVTLDGAAVAVADFLPSVTGRLYYPNSWITGYGNYAVAYEHGMAYPPERIKQAALLLCKNWLVKGPIDDRTTAFSTEDGTYSLATPGLRGSMFGIPEVDAAVAEYAMRVGIA